MRARVLPLLIILLILSSYQVSAYSMAELDSEPVGVKDFWGITDVGQGEKIKVKVKVSVKSTSPVPLEGYCVKVIFRKPDGVVLNPIWFCRDTVIQPGQSETVTLVTGVTADQLGTWTVWVKLYTRDKQNHLDTAEATFNVVKRLPDAEITITDVIGYTALASMLIGGLYAIRRFVR